MKVSFLFSSSLWHENRRHGFHERANTAQKDDAADLPQPGAARLVQGLHSATPVLSQLYSQLSCDVRVTPAGAAT